MQTPLNEQIKLLSDYLPYVRLGKKRESIVCERQRLIEKRIETIEAKIPEHTQDYVIINSKINQK